MVRPNKRGFTLVEVTVILVILTLLVTTVTPRLASFLKSQQAKSFMDQLSIIGSKARESAISQAQTVDLEYDQAANQFKLNTTDSNGSSTSISTLTLPPTVKTDRFMLGKKDSDSGTWKMNFYPDGTSDGGGVQLSEGNSTFSVVVDPMSGQSRLVQDQMPDQSNLTWQAGDYVHRTQ